MYSARMHITLQEVARIAANLGHQDLEVRPRGRDFIAVCSCGYVSAKRRTPALAAQAAARHMQLIVTKWQAAGSPMRSRDTPHQSEQNPRSAIA
jgi:hypothetical protein